MEDFCSEIKDENFSFAQQKWMLTYKTHIDKVELIKYIENKLNGKCKFIRCAHENADINNPYQHTHVVIDKGTRYQTKNCRFLDVTVNNEVIHPNIKKICSMRHWHFACRYLAKEDPDNKDLDVDIDDRPVVQQVWDCSNLQEALLTLRTDKLKANEIESIWRNKPRKEITIDYYPNLSWQLELIDFINTKPNNRTVRWYYGPTGCGFKSTFCRYLQIKFPNKVHSYKTLNLKDGSHVISNLISNGWDGDTIIIDLPRSIEDYSAFYAMIECLKDGAITSLKYNGKNLLTNYFHVIVLSNTEPKYEYLSLDRWWVYNIETNSKLNIDKSILESRKNI